MRPSRWAVTTASSEAVIRAISPSRGLNTTDIVIRAVHVQEGAPVRQGQLLFEVVDEVRQQGVRLAEAAVVAATAEVERVQRGIAVNERAAQAGVEPGMTKLEAEERVGSGQSSALEGKRAPTSQDGTRDSARAARARSRDARTNPAR